MSYGQLRILLSIAGITAATSYYLTVAIAIGHWAPW